VQPVAQLCKHERRPRVYPGAMEIRTERVYDWSPDAGEYAALVDRLWPRGVKKERLAGAHWDKEVTPSPDLRKRFHSGTVDFPGFAGEYRAELEGSDAPAALVNRAAATGAHTLVLLFASKDTAHNHAEVLADYLRGIAG
jgi:uncharacterized protein YeaO (DUF488 family)